MKWFDRNDARLLAKLVLFSLISGASVVGCAAVAGASVHVFRIAAGG